MTMRSVPAPLILAPMAIRKFARSTTSGSRAAFSITVSPSASAAAIIRFSVPVTVTVSSTRRAPLQPLGACADVAAFDVDVRAHGLQAGDVDIHRPRADRAAAGQRHVGAAEARQQRAQHQDRGAHGLDQLVGREILADRARIDLDAHALIDGHRHAHAPEQLDGGGDVLQVRHVADRDRSVGQQRAGQDRQRRILGAGNAHLALERRCRR